MISQRNTRFMTKTFFYDKEAKHCLMSFYKCFNIVIIIVVVQHSDSFIYHRLTYKQAQVPSTTEEPRSPL